MSVWHQNAVEVILQFKLQLNYPIPDNQQSFFRVQWIKTVHTCSKVRTPEQEH